jgi:subtilisin family serine protease
VDGGFDLDHEAVAGRLLPGIDVLDGDDDPTDRGNLRDDDDDGTADGGLGHGTAVASLVLTLAPAVRVYAVRALDDEGVATTSSIAAGIDWSIRRGVNVINVSAGSMVKSQIVDQMLARAAQAGIQVVGSAGNRGTEGVSYPARSPYSIAVTGVSDDLVRDDAASYGAEVDAGAPSVRIVAPFPRTTDGYGWWTGTSFAAPLFSATVALGVQSGLGRAREVAVRALQSAAPYAYVAPECSGEVGKGIVSVRATLGQ